MSWGYTLLTDSKNCDYDAIISYENIYNFSKELVEKIEMIAFGEPQIVNFGSGPAQGFTLVQLIETSSITGHWANDSKEAYIDVFSCKKFDQEIVLEIINKYFKPSAIKKTYIERQA